MLEQERPFVDTQLLTAAGSKPMIELLRYVDVPRAVDRVLYARKENILHHYIFDTPDANKNPTVGYRDRVQMLMSFMDGVRKRGLLTINHGDSILLYSPAPETVPKLRRAINAAVHNLIGRVMSVFGFFYTREQRKRRGELMKAYSTTIAATLGGKLPKLMSIDNLATAAEKQGLGYASLLVNYVLNSAATQSRGVWLQTNERTVGFYERCGFKKVGQYSIGEHNPTWTEGPITQCILLWEPRKSEY